MRPETTTFGAIAFEYLGQDEGGRSGSLSYRARLGSTASPCFVPFYSLVQMRCRNIRECLFWWSKALCFRSEGRQLLISRAFAT